MSRIDLTLEAARARLIRLRPEELDAALADGELPGAVVVERIHLEWRLDAALAGGALVVDLRPEADRHADGELPGAVVVERIHLEWRLDPTSPHRLPGVGPDRTVVLVCNEGYASSLAAVALLNLGLDAVTDLEGGYRAWAATHERVGAGS